MLARGVLSALALVALSVVAAPGPPSGPTYNNGIHLVVGPNCGKWNGPVSDVKRGLPDLTKFKTIVAFGDSFTTDGVKNGSTPAPPVLTGTSPEAGGRTTNGLTWVEDLAADAGAKIMDYAVGGAVVNVTLWPSKSTADDFVSQVARFLVQDNALDPATTLYTSFFGINDWGAANKDGDHLPEAAADYLALVEKLRGPPTNAQYWLALDAYGRYTADAKGDAYKQAIFDGLGQMGTHSNHAQKLEYAFVDLKTLWNGVLETPGYQAFGYTNDTSCLVSSNSIVGACADPDHTFYWIPEHPSKQTHRIMADYIEQVLYRC